MIFLYILLAVILLIALILISHIRIKIEFSENLNIKFYFGVIKIPEALFKKKAKKSDKKSSTKSKEQNKKRKSSFMQSIKKKGFHSSLVEVIDFFKPVGSILGRLTSKIKVNPLIVKVKMTGTDAAKLAIDYGKFCAVYYPVIKLIESKTDCKNINSNIFVDYVSEKTEIYVKTEIKIRLIHGLTHGFKIIMEFIKFKEKFK